MSGFEQLEPRAELIAFFNAQSSPIAKQFRVMNDSEGSIFTASADGGLVIIAGTGSIAQRILPDGQSARCGGMGHMFSDGEERWGTARLRAACGCSVCVG